MDTSRRDAVKGLLSLFTFHKPLTEVAVSTLTGNAAPPPAAASASTLPDAAASPVDTILQHFYDLAASAQKTDAVASDIPPIFKRAIREYNSGWNWSDDERVNQRRQSDLADAAVDAYERSLGVLAQYRDNLRRVFDGDMSALDNIQKETDRLLRLRDHLTHKEHAADIELSNGKIPGLHRDTLQEIDRQLQETRQKLHLTDIESVEKFVKGYKAMCEVNSSSFYREKHHQQLVDELMAQAVDHHVWGLFGDKQSSWLLGTEELRMQFNDALRISLGVAPAQITSSHLAVRRKSKDKNYLRAAGVPVQQSRYDTRINSTTLSELEEQLGLNTGVLYDAGLSGYRIPYVPLPGTEDHEHPDIRFESKLDKQPETLLQFTTHLRHLGERVPKEFLDKLRERYHVPAKTGLFSYLEKHYCKMPRARKQWLIEQASRPVASPIEDFPPENPADEAQTKTAQGKHTRRLLENEEYIQHPGADEPGAQLIQAAARRWPGKREMY